MVQKYSKTQKLDFKACAEFVPKRVTIDLLRIYYVKLHSKSLLFLSKSMVLEHFENLNPLISMKNQKF